MEPPIHAEYFRSGGATIFTHLPGLIIYKQTRKTGGFFLSNEIAWPPHYFFCYCCWSKPHRFLDYNLKSVASLIRSFKNGGASNLKTNIEPTEVEG